MTKKSEIIILGIESSCDDTAAAISIDGQIVANVVANQDMHAAYGGVVPELASRAHLANFVPSIAEAIRKAGIQKSDIDAIAVTNGPGLMGSLVVGVCGARGLAAGLNVPLIAVNHMDAHIMSCFIDDPKPTFPFLCLTISGGHSQLTIVRSASDMTVIGKTLDDAAGEAFDKIGKLLGLPYPAGPLIDQLAEQGQARFDFTHASIPDYDFSFSGLKTQVMYFLRDSLKKNPDFIEQNKFDIAASVRKIIVDMLMAKLESASNDTGLKTIAIAGGVSANKEVRRRLQMIAEDRDWDIHIPALKYSTDNAAMIATSGYYKFLEGDLSDLSLTPFARFTS